MLEGNFTLRNRSYVLGAPISVCFEYSNMSSELISFVIGNSTEDGFRFVCSAESVRQLNPYHVFGGLTEVVQVQPGSQGSKEIPLNRYLEFCRTGDYEIGCEFDARLTDTFLSPVGICEFRGTIHLTLHQDRDGHDAKKHLPKSPP